MGLLKDAYRGWGRSFAFALKSHDHVGRFPTAFDSSAAKTTAFAAGNLHSAYQRNERTLAGVQAENNESKKPSAPYRLSILIADDEVDMAMTLAEMLRDEGHMVHTTANANMVSKAIERFKPDVCLLDIVMPGKSGFAIAREVMAMKLEHRPVLIAISGVFNSTSDEVVARSAGFDFFIRKGTDPGELLGLVNSLAGGPDTVTITRPSGRP